MNAARHTTHTPDGATPYVVIDGSGDTIECPSLVRAARWLLKCDAAAVVTYRGRVIMYRTQAVEALPIVRRFGEAANDATHYVV